MKPIQIIAQDLFDKVRSRFSNLEMGNEAGAVTIDPAEARFFDFDFVSEGNDLGRVSISLNDLGSLKIYYSQGITENQDDPAKKIWYSFLKEMRYFAMRRLLRFDTRDIAKTNLDKNDFQHLAATQGPKEEPTMNMNETKKIRKGVSENAGRELTNTPRDRLISRMSPSVDNNALMQKVGKVVNSPEFNSDTILKIVDSPNITHPVGLYIQKEFDELQYDLGRAYEDHPEEVAEKLLSMLKDRTQQGLQEGRWSQKSTKKTSRAVKGSTEVIVRHANPVDEEYAGSRSQRKNIKAIFIQNALGERFKYPFIHPAGAFAMAQHVDHGGVPHDPAGKAIIMMSEQIAQLQEFQRKIQRTSLHDDAMGITERAVGRLQELKSRIEALSKRHHYESWIAEFNEREMPGDDLQELDAVTMEEYKSKFTETNFKEELAGFFPLLHSIMREANKVDLENYVSEEKEECEKCHCDPCECNDEVKESAFAQFEEWADATEQGKLTDDQIAALKQALAELPQGQTGPELDFITATDLFNNPEFGLTDLPGFDELENSLQGEQNRGADIQATPIQLFQAWAKENYPELLTALGMSGTQSPAEPAPEQPQQVAEAPEDWTSNNVAKILFDKGMKYNSAKDEGPLITAIGDVLEYELGMSKKQVKYLIRYDDDFLADTLSALHDMSQQENTDMTPPPGAMEEDKGSMTKQVAEKVKSFYNISNEDVAPFRAEENIATDIKKEMEEQFGEEAAEQAHDMALAFMQKKNQEWQQTHGKVAAGHGDDGLARLKELVGNIKSKVEGIGDRGTSGKDFNNNIMPAEENTEADIDADLVPGKFYVMSSPSGTAGESPDNPPGGFNSSEEAEQAKYEIFQGSPDEMINGIPVMQWNGKQFVPPAGTRSPEMESILKLAGLAK